MVCGPVQFLFKRLPNPLHSGSAALSSSQRMLISIQPETTFRYESLLAEWAVVRHSHERGNPEKGLSG